MRKICLIFCLILTLHFKNSPFKDWFDLQYLPLSLLERATYLGAGTLFEASSVITYFFPWQNDIQKLRNLLNKASFFALNHAFNGPSNYCKTSEGKWIPEAYKSWEENQIALSQIPMTTLEDQNLVSFLARRWLSKANGFYPVEVHYSLPCFHLITQVSPETKNSYARDPFSQTSLIYENRIATLDSSYPIILTRPFAIEKYLPSYTRIDFNDALDETMQKIVQNDKTILDIAPCDWEKSKAILLQKCHEHQILPEKILCARIDEGMIQILPFTQLEKDHQFLLSWISSSGLTANPAELDRISPTILQKKSSKVLEEIIPINLSPITDLEEATSLMVEGLLSNLRSIEPKTSTPTEQAIIQLSFSNIAKQIHKIRNEKLFFYQTMDAVEQAYLNLTNILEIDSPYTFDDFSSAYSKVTPHLEGYTTFGLLSSGMTCVAGIIHAIEKTICTKPRIIYGENTYFECIRLAQKTAHSISDQEAKETDWQNVDLLFLQFNPVLKRDHKQHSSYHVEQVALNIRKALSQKRIKPVTVALDATIDYLHSTRIQSLLTEFQQEIKNGQLNLFCYRSGLKFDLFGMDNHAGAPCFIIHNQKHNHFDFFTDPALQTDRLSLQWFTLAFKNSSRHLDHYRKQIFANTRTFLNTVDPALYNTKSPYHLIDFDADADPSFIDIQVRGPFHQIRAAAIVGGSLYLNSLQAKHPIFYRRSFGFYHPNFGILFGKDSSTIRLTLGLDPSQIPVFAACLKNLTR